MNKRILFLLYIIFGCYVLTLDTDAFILYITILPIQYLFLKKSIDAGYVSLIVMMALLFVALGVNSFTFFINREKYSPTGFSAVGDFDFTLSWYFQVYSYFFIYTIAILFFSFLFFKIYKIKPSLLNLKKTTEQLVSSLTTSHNYDRWFILLSILSSLLSIWMFNNQIGITGMQQKELPFHLTGILYYFRRYILILLIIYLYFKSQNKKLCFFVLICTAIIIGVCSSSRSIAVFLLFPVIFDSFANNKKIRFLLSVFILIIVYQFISISRNFLYSDYSVSYSISELLSLGYTALKDNEKPSFFYLLNEITGRFFGGADIIVASQQNFAKLGDIFIYYLGFPKSWIITDVEENIYGVSLPPDMAFGMGLGYTQFFIILSNNSYVLSILQSLFIAIYIVIIERTSHKTLSTDAPLVLRILPILLSSFGLFSVFIGASFSFLLGSILFGCVINILIKVIKKGRIKIVSVKSC